jgi:hypothetical protein
MIYKIYTGFNYVYRNWSPGLPNLLLSPFHFTQLEISTAGTFSHVYVCTQHINTDQYRFYALNYFDFTLLSSAKMTISKIESMTENYPEFPVAT